MLKNIEDMTLDELESFIRRMSQKYYTDGSSDISDEEFDKLLERLKVLNPNSELFTVGHGYEVIYDSTPGEKFLHRYGVMGSLDKCRAWSELNNTFKYSYVDCSLKLDGLSVILYYYKNYLVQALTRGDGKVGIDITDKIKKIFPHVIVNTDDPFTGAVRGEIIMSYENFDRYKLSHPEMKNPRNTTAGIINSKDGSGIEFLTVLVYTIVGDDSDDRSLANRKYRTSNQIRHKLVEWFGRDRVVPHSNVFQLDEREFSDKMNVFKTKWYGTYPADGIVITKNDLPYDKCKPRCIEYDAQAFKFRSEIKMTEVVRVIWNMSKTRYAVPKVQIKPIELAGTTVEYCTGYNAQYIRDNKIGPGATVSVEKRGEIIPNIQTIVYPAKEPSMISQCPECGSKLIWDGVHLRCDNTECANASIQDLLVWINTLVPTDNLGDKLILKFLDDLDLDDLSVESVMQLTNYLAEDMKSVQWNTFAKMMNTLRFNKDVKFKLVDAIRALNIPRMGSVNALKLAMYPGLVEYLISSAMYDKPVDETTRQTLSSKIGNANAESCIENVNKFKRLDFIYDRIDMGIGKSTTNGKVAITGKLSVKRSDFEKLLQSKGWTVGDISKDTKYLITDDPNSNSSKNQKADKLGVTKITEKEFRRKFLGD